MLKSRGSKRSIVLSGLLLLFGLVSFIETFTDLTPWISVILLAGAGFGVFGVFLTDREDSILLIPAYVLWSVSASIALIEINLLGPSYIPIYISIISTILFLAVYFHTRTQKWALWLLIPAYITFVVGFMFGLIEFDLFRDGIMAVFISTAAALPFLVIYLRNRGYWWALILAYVLLSVGILFLLLEVPSFDLIFPAAISILAAIPFLFVYFNNRKNWWALILGGIFGLVGLGFLIDSTLVKYILPISLTIAGVWVLYRQLKSS